VPLEHQFEGYICMVEGECVTKDEFCIQILSLHQTIPYGDYLLIGLIHGSVVYRYVYMTNLVIYLL